MEITSLEPKRVFHYFNAICAIPHGSYNTKALSDYCVEVATSLGLSVTQDSTNNVIIEKPASPGYENAAPVILQGHLDMVCEKTDDSDHDFTKDGLSLCVDGDWISAEGTTLGGDDGIAVAYGLALLEDKTIAHPKLYIIFTTEEEVGMDGAHAIDLSSVQDAAYLINLDSEDEGILLAGCAGGARAHVTYPLAKETVKGYSAKISVSGLTGGHSGQEIIRFGANATIVLGMILRDALKEIPFGIARITGGTKDNVITKKATADIVVSDAAVLDKLNAYLKTQEVFYRNVYGIREPGLTVSCTPSDETLSSIWDKSTVDQVLFAITQAPNGVIAMSCDMEGLVETSLNLGILETREHELYISYSIRSAVDAARTALVHRLQTFTEYNGGQFETGSSYPAWEYKRESVLRDKMAAIYKDMTGNDMVVEAIHAGLECGLISNKLPHLDMVSIGPDMKDIHTPDERLSISSTSRTWDYLLTVLKNLK